MPRDPYIREKFTRLRITAAVLLSGWYCGASAEAGTVHQRTGFTRGQDICARRTGQVWARKRQFQN